MIHRHLTKAIICVALLFTFPVLGQDVILLSQADVDAFDPSTTTILGVLEIGPSSGNTAITNLDNLSNLTSIDGAVTIKLNEALENLEGLNNINTLEELLISNNDAISSLEGINNLSTLILDLTISGNNALTSLDGFENLISVGGKIWIIGNDLLTNINGLNQLSSIGEDFILNNNNSLSNLDGLDSVKTIGDKFFIRDNASLSNLDGIKKLESIGGSLSVEQNNTLVNCCGIHHLLSSANAVGGSITLQDNPFPCDSNQALLDTECGLTINVVANGPCVGSDNGALQIDVKNYDAPPFSYAWERQEDGQTGSGQSDVDLFAISMLSQGTYNVTVTTFDDIDIESNIILSEITGSIFEIIEIQSTNSSNGLENGSIAITLAGGIPPYNITWSGIASGSQLGVVNESFNLSALTAGAYAITVSDSEGKIQEVELSLLDETVTIFPCTKALDIVILNDVSGSVDQVEYQESKEFFIDFLHEVNIGVDMDDSRAAIIEWSGDSDQEVKIEMTGLMEDLEEYIDYSRSFDNSTAPHEALIFGESYLADEARVNAERVLILSTDGTNGQISPSLIALADQFKSEGYHIMTIAFDGAYSQASTRNILSQVASIDLLAPGAPAYSLLDEDLAKNIVNLYLCPIDPGSTATAYFNRDGALDILNINPIGNCTDIDQVEITFTVKALRELSIPVGTTITFYHNNPALFGATPILTYQIPCAIPVGTMETFTLTLPVNGPSNIFAVFNDDGLAAPPINFPITEIEELAYSNNIDNENFCTQITTLQAFKYTTTPIPACGNTINYTINVCNISQLDAFGVTIEDVAPEGFVLSGMTFNSNGCSSFTQNGVYDIPAGCCVSLAITYDASNAPLEYYNDQDVILGGPNNQIYIDFDGATSTAEDVLMDGTIDCPSTVITFSKEVSLEESCDNSFIVYTFKINNEMNIPIQGLTFSDILPEPVSWVFEPYSLQGLTISNSNIDSNSAFFVIDQIEPNTVAQFSMDANIGTWFTDGILNNSATLENVPDALNGGFNTLTSNTTNTQITASPFISFPDTIIVNNSLDDIILNPLLSTMGVITWTSSGDGIFGNNQSASTYYQLGMQDTFNNEVTLFISIETECSQSGKSVVILLDESCGPILPGTCNDNDCNTEDTYDYVLCECVNTLLPPPSCDDQDCTTTDSYDPSDCNCIHTPIPPLTCDDQDCNTEDNYDTAICECVYTPIPPPSCDDFDCQTEDTYDTNNCSCIHTPIFPLNCDDQNCTTDDFYDATFCECIHNPIPPPNCDDQDCTTEDVFDTNTCNCVYTPISSLTCDDQDCNTDDFYDATICDCVHTIIPPLNCDDNDCATIDSYDSNNCNCLNTPITPSFCDDQNCNTEDSFDAMICDCVHTLIPPLNCNDNDCATEDSYDTNTCSCLNTPIAPTTFALTESANISCPNTCDAAIDLTILSGVGPFSFEWNTSALNGLANPSNLCADLYSVTVTDGHGCQTVNSITISDNNIISTASISGNATLCFGDSTDLSIQFTGEGPYYFTYAINNINQAPITTLENPFVWKVAPIVTNEYSLIDFSDNDCIGSISGNVLVNINPLPVAVAGTDSEITCGENPFAILDGTASNQNAAFMYTWSGPDDDFDTDSLISLVEIPGIYTLTILDTNTNCSASDQVEVVINAATPVASILQDSAILNCLSEVYPIDGSNSSNGSNIIFEWNGPNIQNTSSPSEIIANTQGTYLMSVTDTLSGCFAHDSIVIIDHIAYPNLDPGSFDILTCNIEALVLDAQNSQSSPSIIHVWINPLGDTISHSTFATATIPGNYTFIGLDEFNHCLNDTIITILQDIAAPLVDAGDDTELDCDLSDVNIGSNNSATGDHILYEWETNADTEIPLNTDQHLVTNQAGTYILSVSNLENGCSNSDSVLVYKKLNVPSQANILTQNPSCFGEEDAQLIIDNVTGGIPPYLYSLDGTNFSTNQQFNFLSPGNYNIYIQDSYGCLLEIQDNNIDQNFGLNPDLGDDIEIDFGESHNINGLRNILPNEVQSIEWKNVESLDCDDCLQPIAMPYYTTTYQVLLTDIEGCTTTDDLKITVNRERKVYIPNSFSPNGDGTNDRLTIFSNEAVFEIKKFLVADRWGGIIFEDHNFQPNNVNRGWDGTFNNEKLGVGVYVYYAQIEFIDGSIEEFKGDIFLVR